MVTEQELQEPTQALCLRVSAESDPGALARVVGFFQTLNIVPRRVLAEFGTDAMLRIRVDVAGPRRASALCHRGQDRANPLYRERLLASALKRGLTLQFRQPSA